MNFDLLDKTIPEITVPDDDDLHTETYYWTGGHNWAVRIKWPGKYRSKSRGDFVVETLDTRISPRFKQVKHSDMFADYSTKLAEGHGQLLSTLDIVAGRTDIEHRINPYTGVGMHPDAFNATMLGLAVCEHRRYPQAALRGGGRYLPINFMLAIERGAISVDEASSRVRYGLPVLEGLKNFVPFTSNDIPALYWQQVHLAP